MKLQKLYSISIIIVMLSVISFDAFSLKLIDNSLETKIEVSIEEKKSEIKLDKNLILSDSRLNLQDTKVSDAHETCTPIANQFYLNDIFRPPIFS